MKNKFRLALTVEALAEILNVKSDIQSVHFDDSRDLVVLCFDNSTGEFLTDDHNGRIEGVEFPIEMLVKADVYRPAKVSIARQLACGCDPVLEGCSLC